ncbi:D-Ala-D-Ala carboxypeptidase family metallohydrolase [Yunchengibacter salinarum]|uniref:D-Ala-D-Ala carboxypeptidase family metallohydrolase n=1 Tax=Yunchengibacter salinarum TaxID=3133399 RepID=UPI0035B66828
MMHDIQLSPHFRLEEFTRSSTARRRGIVNRVSEPYQVANLRQLCRAVLEPLRALYRRPIVITSGFRSPALNRALGGVPESQHLLGEAADLVMPGVDVADLARVLAASDLPFDQMILDSRAPVGDRPGARWLHISHRRVTDNRGDVLRLHQPAEGPARIQAGLGPLAADTP